MYISVNLLVYLVRVYGVRVAGGSILPVGRGFEFVLPPKNERVRVNNV